MNSSRRQTATLLPPMHIGYNTNGFPFHRLDDAVRILADLGYQSIAITLDHHALDPFSADLKAETNRIRHLLEQLHLQCVIETGARFLLDPRRKHQPTLLSTELSERERRLDFLRRAVDIAHELNAQAVSFWSGTALSAEPADRLRERLTDGCRELADHAAAKNIRLAFEPEPGMFIDTMKSFQELLKQVAHPAFGLTLDIGHLHCLGETPISDYLREWKHLLWNVHIEDMRHGVHDHLMFGEGEIDFKPVLQTLHAIGYIDSLHVELSRHGHDAVETARKSMEFLQSLDQPPPGFGL